MSNAGGGYTIYEDLEVKNVPAMLNYRYLFLKKASPVRIYVGPSLGFNRVTITDRARLTFRNTSVATGQIGESNTSFTWGGTAGVLVKVSDTVNFDLGYRYLNTKAKFTKYALTGAVETNMVGVGLDLIF